MKAIFFDLDGTLLNTLTDLTNSVNFALCQLGLPSRTEEEVKSMIGNGLSVLIKRALGKDNADYHSQALQLQRAFYAQHGTENTHPYEGVCDILQNLKQQGFVVGVYTNKDENIAKILCDKMLAGHCDYVCGTVKDGQTKPNAERLLQLLTSLGNPKAVYCGDSEVDLQTAKNANLPCISVTWGFKNKQFLQSCGAKYFAETPQDIVHLAQILTCAVGGVK